MHLSAETTRNILWGTGFFALGLVISLALVVLVLVRLPETYFLGAEPPPFFPGRPLWQMRAAHIGKNALGVLLILLGIILSIPGVPGQGVMTILIGMTLLDLPGKRRFEQRIMKHAAVLGAANRIRARFGKPPFQLDSEEPARPTS